MIKLRLQIGQSLLYKTDFIRQGLPCYVVDEYTVHTQFMGSRGRRQSQILQKKCDVEGRILVKGGHIFSLCAS